MGPLFMHGLTECAFDGTEYKVTTTDDKVWTFLPKDLIYFTHEAQGSLRMTTIEFRGGLGDHRFTHIGRL